MRLSYSLHTINQESNYDEDRLNRNKQIVTTIRKIRMVKGRIESGIRDSKMLNCKMLG